MHWPRKYAEVVRACASIPETEITVTCGATEAMAATLLALVNPGDEVIVPEPFYENYGPDAILCDARPVYRPALRRGSRSIWTGSPPPSLARTRAIIINTPNNPTGRVLTRPELEAIAELCQRHDAWAITDEIYEHIRYRASTSRIATLPGMRERTVTISGASKTFSVTGWRVGPIVAPPGATDAIRKVHDFLTVGAPAPLAGSGGGRVRSRRLVLLRGLAADYRRRGISCCPALRAAGFPGRRPKGPTTSWPTSPPCPTGTTSPSPLADRESGVAAGAGFELLSASPRPAAGWVRFAFCKTDNLLTEAAARLDRVREAVPD